MTEPTDPKDLAPQEPTQADIAEWDGKIDDPNALRKEVIAVLRSVALMPEHRHYPVACKMILELYPEVLTQEQQMAKLLQPFN